MRIHWLTLLVLARTAAGQPASDQPAPPPPLPPGPDQQPAPSPPAPPPPAQPVPAQPPPAPQPPPPSPVQPPPPAEPHKSDEQLAAEANYEPSSVAVGGYLQVQFRSRQNSDVGGDQEGFRFARARLTTLGQTRAGNLALSAFFEAELYQNFTLQDAYASVRRELPGDGRITIDAGQMRVPISRQNLLSDANLAFVDKGQLATIAPDRDLGLRAALAVPKIRKVRLLGGIFNGEGKNQVENINEKYLYAVRVEISPFGRDRLLAESAFGERFITAAFSYGHNAVISGTNEDRVQYVGYDISGAAAGLSASFEYLEVRHEFRGSGGLMPFHANGFLAQANYLLPVPLPPYKQARLELGARVEEIDRNDTVPIVNAGDPEQSVREITGVVSYYLRMHSLKAQLAASHFQELEDRTATGENAAYKNDQLLLQVTYRLE